MISPTVSQTGVQFNNSINQINYNTLVAITEANTEGAGDSLYSCLLPDCNSVSMATEKRKARAVEAATHIELAIAGGALTVDDRVDFCACDELDGCDCAE